MANFRITPANSISTSMGDALGSAAANDTVEMTTGAYLMASGAFSGIALTGTGISVASINGTVTSSTFSAIRFGSQTLIDVTVGSAGFVSGASGIESFSQTRLINAGVIAGDTVGGVVLLGGSGHQIVNLGYIGSAGGPAIATPNIFVTTTIINSGTISGATAIAGAAGWRTSPIRRRSSAPSISAAAPISSIAVAAR